MATPRREQVVSTLALYFIFLGSGITYNMIAPTLLELKGVLNVTTAEVSGVYTARSTGYIIGAPLGAFLFGLFNRQLVIATLVAIMSACNFLLPLWRQLSPLFLFAGLSGMASGGMEAGVNVWLLEIWGDKSCPWMQALHLCFALGCAIAPLIAVQFLSKGDSGQSEPVANVTANFTGSASANGSREMTSNIQIPYSIAGSIVGVASVVMFVLYFTMAYNEPKKQSVQETEMEPMDSSERRAMDKMVKGLKNRLPCKKNANATDIVIFACLTMLFYSGMSIIYSQFMPTYLQNFELKLSSQTASYINSAMYYVSTLSRAISVPLALKLKPQFFVYMNCFMLGFGSLILLFFGGMSLTVTWVGNIFIGIGSASVSAPMYSFLKQHIEVTNTIGSIFVFSSGLTSVAYPLLVGYFIEKFPEFLLYLNVINISLTVFFFTLIYFNVAIRNRPSSNRRQTANEPAQNS